MKDLLCYTADADALGFMKSILNRHPALGIREISFELERHPLRDSGMVQSAAELTRMQKSKYHKALLLLDHHGSGRDKKQSAQALEHELQIKLNAYTWLDNSCVVVIVPELEEWLWHSVSTLATHYKLTASQIVEWAEDWAKTKEMTFMQAQSSQPKEMFEFMVRYHLQKTISPRDFELMAQRVSISALQKSASFLKINQTLKNWFA